MDVCSPAASVTTAQIKLNVAVFGQCAARRLGSVRVGRSPAEVGVQQDAACIYDGFRSNTADPGQLETSESGGIGRLSSLDPTPSLIEGVTSYFGCDFPCPPIRCQLALS